MTQAGPDLTRLKAIAGLQYGSYEGPRPFLTEEEVVALSVPRGNLTQVERQEIERHVTYTFEFLSKIPWTRALRDIPAIAWSHHEKLDGTGYPRGLTHEQIPLQARIMAICDIYDALTASDRPYKTAVSQTAALGYLQAQSKEGKLDAELVRIFVEKRIYRATQSRANLRNIA
jgi:HD-GYP domain-containing protein (c-di-GMP phosphodiesterase class II)